MRYFFDTEFIENGKTIDLISIGIVAEDGRKYYAISKDFNPNEADDWVVRNVLNKLPPMLLGDKLTHDSWWRKLKWNTPKINYLDSPNRIAKARYWKSNTQIKEDILQFCNIEKYGIPEFWAYYADYDWVVFCRLFGKMIDLPKGFPMYCNDLKQLIEHLNINEDIDIIPNLNEHNALADAEYNQRLYEYITKNHNYD